MLAESSQIRFEINMMLLDIETMVFEFWKWHSFSKWNWVKHSSSRCYHSMFPKADHLRRAKHKQDANISRKFYKQQADIFPHHRWMSSDMKLEFKLAKCLLNYPSQTTPEQDCLVVDNQDKFVEPSSQIIWLDKYIKGICKFSSPIYAQIPWGEQVFYVADYWCWWPDEVLQLSLCRLLYKWKGNTVNIATGQK